VTASLRPTDPDPQPILRLRLYVAGASPNSTLAVANLRAALGGVSEHRVELEIVDILEDPDRGLRDAVVLTPMLVRLEPLPERRVLGSLGDRAVLLSVLGLLEATRA
jgi:circadian clock protein KaiB